MNYEKVYQMKLAKVYPLLVAKAMKKGRSKEEVDAIIEWLCGYSPSQLEAALDYDVTYREFFENAPSMNPLRKNITGTICGVKVETIEEPLMQDIRYLDKLIDELAKGKAMDRILRK